MYQNSTVIAMSRGLSLLILFLRESSALAPSSPVIFTAAQAKATATVSRETCNDDCSPKQEQQSRVLEAVGRRGGRGMSM